MLTKNEQKTIERLGRMMQSMNDMQKAQLCAFTEGLAMALEDKTGVNVPDDLMATFRTLNDLLAYLNEQGA